VVKHQWVRAESAEVASTLPVAVTPVVNTTTALTLTNSATPLPSLLFVLVFCAVVDFMLYISMIVLIVEDLF
jgi:hypothetical protein